MIIGIIESLNFGYFWVIFVGIDLIGEVEFLDYRFWFCYDGRILYYYKFIIIDVGYLKCLYISFKCEDVCVYIGVIIWWNFVRFYDILEIEF